MATDRTADAVLGQGTLTDDYWMMNDQSGMVFPTGLSFDSVHNRLFVADCDAANSRVLVFDAATITNGENAANVLGQPNFTTYGQNTTQSGMSAPCSTAYDAVNDRLYVVE